MSKRTTGITFMLRCNIAIFYSLHLEYWPWSYRQHIRCIRLRSRSKSVFISQSHPKAVPFSFFSVPFCRSQLLFYRKHYKRAFAGIRCWWTIEKWNVYHFSVLISLRQRTECICSLDEVKKKNKNTTIFIKTKNFVRSFMSGVHVFYVVDALCHG